MSSEIAIKVENLSKCYQIYDTPRDRLKQFVLPRIKKAFAPVKQWITRRPSPIKNYYKEFWALRDISFEVKKGETVGIIGRNGSGKSTLLQLICGTLTQTTGSIQTDGNIAALLELGSGFNPQFTGRENVYLNASILGLSNEEIDARYADIAAFADIGEFINQPVKTYSSGMFVRLAFAVNIMSHPEIMIVDEALAVGDMAFQAKCMTALRRIQDGGATILFVSHALGSIKSLCSKAVYLERGRMKNFGKAATVVENYVRVMREEMNAQHVPRPAKPLNALSCQKATGHSAIIKAREFKSSEAFDRRVEQFRYGTGGARISFAELVDVNEQPVVSAEFNQKVKIRIYFTVENEVDLSVNYYIQDDKKNLIIGAGLRTVGEPILHCPSHSYHIVTYSTTLPLREGNYSIQFQLTKPIILDQSAEFIDVIDNGIVFNVQRKKSGRIWSKVYVPSVVETVQL
jgi:lipopolysaccharide transport system ATP-binding protein